MSVVIGEVQGSVRFKDMTWKSTGKADVMLQDWMAIWKNFQTTVTSQSKHLTGDGPRYAFPSILFHSG